MSFKINTKKKTSDDLSEEQLSIIKKILDESCVGPICVSRAMVFEETQKHIEVNMEQYRFEQLLTAAIKSKKIAGYETRSGRGGGICRKGVFAKTDKAKKKKGWCHITIDHKTLKVPITEGSATDIIESCSGKPAEHGDGNVFINNLAYKIPETLSSKDFLFNYLVKTFNGQPISNERKTSKPSSN